MVTTSETRIREETVDTEEAHIAIKEEPVSPPPCNNSCEKTAENETDSMHWQVTSFVAKEEPMDVEESLLNEFKEEMLPVSSHFIICENQVKDETPNEEFQVTKSQRHFMVKEEPINAEETALNVIKEEPMTVSLNVTLRNEPVQYEPLTVGIQDSVPHMAGCSGAQSSWERTRKRANSPELNGLIKRSYKNYEETNMPKRELSRRFLDQRGRSGPDKFIEHFVSTYAAKGVKGEDGEQNGGQLELCGRVGRADGKSRSRGQRKREKNKTQGQNFSSKHSARLRKTRKPLPCGACGKCFPDLHHLEIHERTRTGERPFGCALCKKAFARKCDLVVHMRVHSGERPYKCPSCEKSFKTSGSLHTHMRLHSGKKPFQCNVCGKAFRQSGHLISHMPAHTHEKPYVCSQCGNAFSWAHSLTIHMRSHSGEKPYICTECGKGFSDSSNLTRHMPVHIGKRPF